MKKLAFLLLLGVGAFAQTLPNAVPFPNPEIQFLGPRGLPLAGAYLCSFAAGTSTRQDTYTDSTAGTANTNPIVLDVNGRASVWVGPQLYKFVLYLGGNGQCPGSGAVQWSQDNVSDTTLYFANFVKTAGSATIVSYTDPLSGAVQRTVSSRLSDSVSVKDFGAVGDGMADDTTAIQTAFNSAAAAGKEVYIPAGTYDISTELATPASIFCQTGATLKATQAIAAVLVQGAASSTPPFPDRGRIVGCKIDGNALATDAFVLQNAINWTVLSVSAWNGIANHFHIGLPAASCTVGSNNSFGMVMVDAHSEVSTGAAATNAALLMDCMSDSQIATSTFEDGKIGVQVTANSSHDTFKAVHVWNHPSTGTMTTGFDDISNTSIWNAWYADTPTTYCIHEHGFGAQILGGVCYNNSSGADNVLIGIKFDQAGPFGTVIGNRFQGSGSSNRIATDVSGVTSHFNEIGNIYTNVTTQYGDYLSGQRILDTLVMGSFSVTNAALNNDGSAQFRTLAVHDLNNDVGVSLVLHGGTVTNQSADLRFDDFSGTPKWFVTKTAAGDFQVFDSADNLTSLKFTAGGNALLDIPASSQYLFEVNGSQVLSIGPSGVVTANGQLRGNGVLLLGGQPAFFSGVAFASLGSPVDGNLQFCSDCSATAPCTGGGNGRFARGENSPAQWNCN